MSTHCIQNTRISPEDIDTPVFLCQCSVCILHASTDNFGSGGYGGFCFELLLSLDGDGFAFLLAWKA